MRTTIIATCVIVEIDDDRPRHLIPLRRNPLADLAERLRREMQHGRDSARDKPALEHQP